jgi:HEAT repeat protein
MRLQTDLTLLIEAARRHTGAAVRVRRVRADAITALGKLAHPATVAYLGELLGDQENAIARSAAIALGGFTGSPEALDLLRRRGLASEDPWVRALSALSLGRLHDTTALPALARRVRSEDPVVRPFVTLGLGLLGDPGSARLLAEPLAEDPRTGAFASAALAAGLLGADEQRPLLAGALGDTRTAAAPACGALGLGLLHATEVRSVLTARFWFDSTRARPGFAEALALLDAPAQSTWLLGQLTRARRSGERQVLVEALGLCGGPDEGAVLATTFASAPKGDTRLRVRLVGALAGILRDHAVTPARRLLLHTYYLQPNDVLGHLAYLP